ncbi:GlcG/HbpS family heme-binding protein [Novosphingobium jiangmenense]|uniref:Heme-binding protein n=1 Tax=Novosphingobium jiangmenense TaxID=2791981 RepID=A0ABS0HBI3_9SPHN|nr:heme-binding protein [Novosphingobium jiangmenense]MBF9149641.1 heme-binding protein [Novosphingobium jiangmenense]
MSLSLAAAQTITTAALAEARARKAKPLAVIVLDAGGHPVAFAREDGASLFRHDIARAKAMGALGMGDDTRVLAERAKGNAAFFQSVSVVVGGNIAFSPGGVLIREAGTIIGAVGISGDTGECDELCAFAGLKAAGLDPENSK